MIRSTVLTSLVFSALCHADFAGMYVDTSDPVRLGSRTFRSHRVYAVFTDPTDRVISVSGGVPFGPDLEFSVIGPGSLYQGCTIPGGCAFLSCTQTSFASILVEPYHSFLCIRGGSQPSDFPAFGDDVSSLGSAGELQFSPDVFCSADPPVAIAGNAWSTNGVFGGYFTSNPVSGLHEGQLVLLGQFTLPQEDEFAFEGVVDYSLVDPNDPSGNVLVSEPFSLSSSDFTGLSDCLNFEDFFSSFTQAVADDPSQEWDLCEDGIFDLCQEPCTDCDEDGIPDSVEIKQGTAIDLNSNGIDDECDPDCDQNGVPDFFQIEQGAFDCNLDGILDSCEIAEEPALDLNSNTVIDSCEADCNENGNFDFVDLFLGISQDINKNSVPDECEDCDGDGIPDDLEDKADCDGNGLPDVCEVDEDCDNDGDINACDFDDDGDGIEDLCDADSCGITGQDCDENGILDSCEEFSDCNNNGIADRCDIQSGEEDDLNRDGTPDSCQCIADVVPNGEVGFPDLVTLLSAWGTCEPPCPSDIIADGDVGFSDLLYLLSNWGKCFIIPGGGGGGGIP